MRLSGRDALKAAGRGLAAALIFPALVSYWVRAWVIGRDRALEGSTQALACLPGLSGQYLRRAFLGRALAACDPTATVEFGTIFSRAAARIDAHAYVGPRCHLGLVHIERGALLAAGVHVPSGARTHGTEPGTPIREQPGQRRLVRIGAGAWVGSAAVVMADVGSDAVVGAGAVVVRRIPDGSVAVGVPARPLRQQRRA